MNLPYRWLTEFVSTHLSPEALGERIQETSSVLERIDSWSDRLAGLVIGRVISCEAHPDSDHLQVTQVDVGSAVQQIVCGASNVRSDIFVIVALPGSKAGQITIKEATIRGVVSAGMLCSYAELGLPAVEDGIAVLTGSLTLGSDAARSLGLDDSVLDLEITPNRPDLLGIYGLAREVASFEHHNLRSPEVAPASPTLPIIVSASLCYRYLGVHLAGIQVGPSPQEWQSRLLLSGIRPINNLVDVSNYVMLELGQPLHAFDYAMLGDTPKVRLARAGETLACLDGQNRKLSHEDTVITDARNHPAALAGIIGGTLTAVSDSTTEIFLECAVFPPAAVRRSSRRHALRSEASQRIEKGLDPATAEIALRRAIFLLQRHCNAQIVGNILDSGDKSTTALPIRLDYELIHSLLGVSISPAESKRILLSLGFKVEKITKSSLSATPPSWRRDVRLPEDLIEELVRIWGYGRIPATMPSGAVLEPRPNLAFERKKAIRHLLAGFGLNETVSLSLTSKAILDRCLLPIDQAIPVQLPLSKEGEYLIPQHLANFMQNTAGVNRSQENLRIFEIGTVFQPPYTERVCLSFLLRSDGQAELLVAEAKGILEQLSKQLGVEIIEYVYDEEQPPYLSGAVGMKIGQADVGWLGILSTAVLTAWKIRNAKTLLYCSLDLNESIKQPMKVGRYAAPSAYPTAKRDLTVNIAEEQAVGPLAERLVSEQGLQGARPEYVGTYRNDQAGDGRKSVTFRLTYGHDERTLTDLEISADLERLGRLLRLEYAALIN